LAPAIAVYVLFTIGFTALLAADSYLVPIKSYRRRAAGLPVEGRAVWAIVYAVTWPLWVFVLLYYAIRFVIRGVHQIRAPRIPPAKAKERETKP
jgi:hypothetical protein